MLTLQNNSYSIWMNCRLAVRHAAAIIKRFASSIAPHITTILVHGKQVMFQQRWTEDSACLLPVHWLASWLASCLCEVQPVLLCDSSQPGCQQGLLKVIKKTLLHSRFGFGTQIFQKVYISTLS